MNDRSARRPFWHWRRSRRIVETEIDEELSFHLDARAAELVRQGLPPEAARQEARRQFGDLAGTRRYCRQQDLHKEHRMQIGLTLEDVVQDLRIGLRTLARAPAMTAAVLATVGLGIGAVTAMFAAIHTALLQPLPYENPAALVRIDLDAPPNRFPFSVADYLALEAQQTQFERVAGYTDRSIAFSDGRVVERVSGRDVSWTYFSTLRVRPAAGRDFTADDGRPGSPPTALVSHAFWERRLGARAGAVGSIVRLDGVDHTLVGVLPPRAGSLEQGRDVFVAAQWAAPPRRGPFFITAIGRLRSPEHAGAAADELRAISRRVFSVWQTSYQDDRASWSMVDLKRHVVGDVAALSRVALAAVAIVWLMACLNASNLLIARLTARRPELAVRAALGASRARIVRYLLAESALLAIGAAAIGGLAAVAGVDALRSLGTSYFPRTDEIQLAGAALWVLGGLTVASTLLLGGIPAVHGTGASLSQSLGSAGRWSTAGVGARRLRRVLVAGQFAMATPLLVAASLLIVSLDALHDVDPGFEPRGLISGAILLPAAQYREDGRVAAFWEELERRFQAIPGVTGVAFSDGRPPTDVNNWNNFNLESHPTPPGQSEPVTPWVAVSPEYFHVLELTLIEGRLLDDRDGTGDRDPVVVVDRAWARRFFPGGSAVGERLWEGGCHSCTPTTVVGVVSDVRYAGLHQPHPGAVYSPITARSVSFPIETGSSRFRHVILRTAGDPHAVVPAMEGAVRSLDRDLPLSQVATFEGLIERSLDRPRHLSALLVGLAGVALVLSLLGIYGVMAYYVQQHLKEIVIRIALGGGPRDVRRLVVGQGMRVVLGGVALGLVLALGLTQMMSGLLFGVGVFDAATYAGVGALLACLAFGACFLPAQRAVALQPAAVLRND